MYKQYSKVRERLDGDYQDFENRVAELIGKYGNDYNQFVEKSMCTEIRKFTRRWSKPKGNFLNNTYVDALCLYLFTRDMIDTKSGDLLMYEFSPFHGWTTYLMLRAIHDSGQQSRVHLKSCEIDLNCRDGALESLRSCSDLDLDSLEMIHGDAIEYTKTFEDNSIDLLFIDSYHGGDFTKKYIESGLFQKIKPKTYVHVHDFVFWEDCPEKYREPEVIFDYILTNPGSFSQYTFGQLFSLLGGDNTHEILVDARAGQDKYFGTDNFFIRNHLPKNYWLGGTINGVSKKGIHENKTWVSGLALWMIP